MNVKWTIEFPLQNLLLKLSRPIENNVDFSTSKIELFFFQIQVKIKPKSPKTVIASNKRITMKYNVDFIQIYKKNKHIMVDLIRRREASESKSIWELQPCP